MWTIHPNTDFPYEEEYLRSVSLQKNLDIHDVIAVNDLKIQKIVDIILGLHFNFEFNQKKKQNIFMRRQVNFIKLNTI